ncbi:MAG: FliG C-terminal domain-containing protein [Sphingomonadales bacterium]|jgi:flagellar motor switch protein FliG
MTAFAPPPLPTAETLTGAQKCAILLLVLEDDQAADMLGRMAPDEVQAVGEAMLTVAEIDPGAIDAVLDEFLSRTRRVTALDHQGRHVRQMLNQALGSPRAERVIDTLGPPVAPRPFAMLDWLNPVQLAALLADEHPQAVTVVLAHLPETRAAAVLDALPEAAQPDIATRLAIMGPVAVADVAALADDMAGKVQQLATQRDETRLAGTDFAAAVVKKARSRGALLEALGQVDEALAAEIEAQQFIFADLALLSQKDMQLVLREVDVGLLAVALKAADSMLKDKVFGAMSKRAASQLQDDLAERGPMKRSEVDAAQRDVCRIVRRLGDSGALMLPDAAGGYV